MVAEERLPRKLAAVLYADVAGYSRLTGQDEDATHRVLRAYLELISSAVEAHSGRVVHYAGDAVLADFGTVLDALVCAAAVQRELKERNARFPDERKVQFRIGVNLGDVIVDGEEIYGDGVNVAARLESLAEPGGICISEAVRNAVGNKLPLDFEFMGEQQVKNIERSVRAYHSRLKPGAELPSVRVRQSARERPKAVRRQWPTVVITSAVVLAVLGGALLWLTPWEAPERPDVSEQRESPLDTARRAGKFLSEDEIRNAVVGNTINFRSPLNGMNLFVYFADDGGVTVKGEHTRAEIDVHKWFFKDGDILCRTVLADRRNHCTRVAVGDEPDTLTFLNAKKGIFYEANVLNGRRLPD